MNLKRICAAVAISALPCFCASATNDLGTTLAQHPAWLQRRIHWERAPRDVNPNLSAGAATVLYFSRDGRFGMLSGTVYKQNHRVSVSNGDSESIYKGTWTATGNSVHVVYQLIYHDVRIVDEKLPGPEQTVDFSLETNGKLLKVKAAHGLNLSGFEYEIDPEFSTENLTSQFSFADRVIQGENSDAKPR